MCNILAQLMIMLLFFFFAEHLTTQPYGINQPMEKVLKKHEKKVMVFSRFHLRVVLSKGESSNMVLEQVTRDSKTGQPDPFWPGLFLARFKWVGLGWPNKAKRVVFLGHGPQAGELAG